MKRLRGDDGMGGGGGGELFVTSKLGLSIWSFIDLEKRMKDRTGGQKGACASHSLAGERQVG